jgi:hypothetical protein
MRLSILLGISAAVLVIVVAAYASVLRPWHLRWGTVGLEASETLPGDDLLEGTVSQVTRAITINAPPQAIWPWLMQIGQDRAGFYSYTALENLIGADMPEIHTLRPQWEPRVPGEVVWFANPKRFQGEGKMIAAVVDEHHAFVMVMKEDWLRLSKGGRGTRGSWAFVLRPLDESHTRLIARQRSGPPLNIKTRLAGSLFWEPAHFVMERKMLVTIKELAEQGGK